MSNQFQTESEASVALRLAGYEIVNEAACVYRKGGYKVKIVRNGWKAAYEVVPYKEN